MAAGTPARQRGDGPRRRPRGRRDGRQRAVLQRAVAVRGHPPGRRRGGARGDAAVRPAGGLHRRRPRGRGGARPTTPGPADGRQRHDARDRRRRPGRPGGLERGARARPVRHPEVGARRRRRRSRRRQLRRVRRPAGADRAARRLARRLPGRHLARLAAAPRAGRPDRLADLARPLHPVRHQRRHPALGRLLVGEGTSWRSTPTRTPRWSPRRRTP